MNIKMLKAAVVGLVLSVSSFASAGMIVNGALEATTNDDGSYAITVDFWEFSVLSAGFVNFDVLSWESSSNDVNSSGDFYFIDSMLWLFNNDGALDTTDLLAENDDSILGSDGSISDLDSNLSSYLNPGNYILAIGACCNFGATDIIDGKQNSGLYAFLNGIDFDNSHADNNPAITHGDYQITFSGDLSVNNTTVPEPSTLAIFALGIMGLASRRLKKK